MPLIHVDFTISKCQNSSCLDSNLHTCLYYFLSKGNQIQSTILAQRLCIDRVRGKLLRFFLNTEAALPYFM